MNKLKSFIDEYKKQVGCKNVKILGSKDAIDKLNVEELPNWIKVIDNNYVEDSDKIFIINGDEEIIKYQRYQDKEEE